ncbi:MAG: class E sortase, partial [Acidobacteria bacterium]|nr:class E sortase [Acidobacteriota bacterium]
PAPAPVPAVAAGPPPTGAAVAVLRIPKIGLDKAVVEGVGVTDLRKGPGHYPGTPLPGQAGNAAIAGHRTTYGAPFYRLDELAPGDELLVTTRQGSFRYRVDRREIVRPDDVAVVAPTAGSRLTLTTCNPRFSARQRLVVSAALVGDPAQSAPRPPTPPTSVVASEALGGSRGARVPSLLWGLAATAVALGAWAAGRAWRPWPAYLLGLLPFLAVLYVFFENVSRLLPTNF